MLRALKLMRRECSSLPLALPLPDAFATSNDRGGQAASSAALGGTSMALGLGERLLRIAPEATRPAVGTFALCMHVAA